MPATLEGVEAAQAAYQGLADDMHNLSDVTRLIAQAGEDAARARAPSRTTRLAMSIVGSSNAKEATLGVAAYYWPWQEFGTKYLKRRRYMAAGIRQMRKTAGKEFRKKLSDSWRTRARNANAAAKARKAG